VWRCAVLLGSHAFWLGVEVSRKQQHIGLFVSRLPRCLIAGMYERVDYVGETGWRPCAVLLLLSGRGKGFTVKIRPPSIDDDMRHLQILMDVEAKRVQVDLSWLGYPAALEKTYQSRVPGPDLPRARSKVWYHEISVARYGTCDR